MVEANWESADFLQTSIHTYVMKVLVKKFLSPFSVKTEHFSYFSYVPVCYKWAGVVGKKCI